MVGEYPMTLDGFYLMHHDIQGRLDYFSQERKNGSVHIVPRERILEAAGVREE